MRPIGLLIAVVVAASLLATGSSNAQQPVATGVSVNPAIQNLTLQSNQAGSSFPVTLENDTDTPVTIMPSTSDFTAVGGNDIIKLLTKPDQLHGLASNLSFSSQKFSLPAHTGQAIQVAIRNAQQLAPGGHYAIIRYQILSGAAGQGQIGINSDLSTFVFLATAGKSTYGVSLKDDLPKLALWKLPGQTDLLFTNTANTQTAPRGYVNTQGPFHRQVVNTIINPNSLLVLPGSTRLYQTTLKTLKPAFWPGHYRVDIYYRANENTGFQDIHQSLFYVSGPFLLSLLALFLGLILIVRFIYKRSHRHKIPPNDNRRAIVVKYL